MGPRARLVCASTLAVAVTVLACETPGPGLAGAEADAAPRPPQVAAGPGEGASSPAQAEGDAAAPSAAVPAPARDAGSWPPPRPTVAPAEKALLVGTWSLAGPGEFDDHAWLDETGLRETYTMRRASRREWIGVRSPDAILPVDRLLDDRAGPAVGYAYLLVMREDPAGLFEPAPALLHLRHRGRVQARLDGRLVADAPAPGAGWAEIRAPVTLTGPYDVLLLKLGRGDGLGASMDVEVRVSARDGSPLPGQAWQTMRPPGRPSDLSRPDWCGRDG